MQKVIVILGPTGVGKTKLSIELAKRLNGEIINADSMQVYKNLNIGTAKPTVLEKQNILHHLFDIKDEDEEYTIYDYQKDARKKIEEIRKKDKTPILVGGSGLYIKAALFDYKFQKETNKKEYKELTNEELLKKIKEYQEDVDIHINNRKRLVRALQILEVGDTLTKEKDPLIYDAIFIGLTTKREKLYQRINKRVIEMFDEGLKEEVDKYKDKLEKYQSLKTGIGYKEFIPFYKNEKTLDEVINDIQKNSRRYAKRQYTFFNHQMDVTWFDVDFKDFDKTINSVYEYIKEKGN